MAQLQVLALLFVLYVGASSQQTRRPPIITYPITTTYVYNTSGSNVVLSCTADGDPKPTYKWMQNESVVVPSDIITFNATTGQLSIKGFTSREAATYICIASNVFDNGLGGRIEVNSWSARMRVFQSRIDRFGGSTVTTRTGAQYTYTKLDCNGQNAAVGPTIIYNWYKYNRQGIDMSGDRLFVDQMGNLHFTYLLSSDVIPNDYYCGISTGNELLIQLGTQYTLQVTPSSSTGAILPQGQYSNTNVKGLLYSSVKLECVFSGYDPNPPNIPTIQWFDDSNTLIVASSKYNFSMAGRVMTISNLLEQDERHYFCKAKNGAGEATIDVFLNVTSGPIFINGPPSDQTVPENTNVQFQCDTRSAIGETPPGPPVWRINGVLMGSQTDTQKMYLSADGKVLNIRNVKKNTDIMCVQCFVYNDIDSVLANACLNVILPITLVTAPKLIQPIYLGDRVNLTITARTDPSMTLNYKWIIKNVTYEGNNHPAYMFYDQNTMQAYVDTAGMSESQFRDVIGVFRRVIYNTYETKNVDIDVIQAGAQGTTEINPITTTVPTRLPTTVQTTRSYSVDQNTTQQATTSIYATTESTRPPIRNDFDCYLTHMNVFVPVDLAPNSVLKLKNTSCQLQNNGTHYVTSFSYDQCGTTQEYYYTNLILVKNEITVHVELAKSDPIQFSPDYTIPLICVVRVNNSAVDSAFQAVDRDQYSPQYGQSPDFEMKEFGSASYQDEITQYPVKVPINREIFFELSLTHVRGDNSGIQVDRCEATPTPDANSTVRFSLISDGCSASPAVKVLPRPELNRYRFSVQTFHFAAPANQNNLVYVHCYLNVCQATNCVSTCPVSKRRRRSLRHRVSAFTLSSGSHIISPE